MSKFLVLFGMVLLSTFTLSCGGESIEEKQTDLSESIVKFENLGVVPNASENLDGLFKIVNSFKAPSKIVNMDSGIQNNTSNASPVSVCKPIIKSCSDEDKYTRLDGSCNNMNNPDWGMANTPFKRMLPPVYADGRSLPRRDNVGGHLPNARFLSTKLFPAGYEIDRLRTFMTMTWGEVVTNDMSHVLQTDEDLDCCSIEKSSPDRKFCYPIPYSKNDLTFDENEIVCQNFIRTTTDEDLSCKLDKGPVAQINRVTAFLDLSFLYGNDENASNSLRSMKNGQLLIERREGSAFPPCEDDLKKCKCNKPGEKICFKTGDSRSNGNPQLALVHTLLLREHNRIANELSKINPAWDDERTFQETRHINIAQYQNIVFYGWLPEVLGWKNLAHANIFFPNNRGYSTDYNSTIRPSVINEFAAVASKYFQSQIPGKFLLLDYYNQIESVEDMSAWLYRPQILQSVYMVEQLTRGLVVQNCESNDKYFANELVNNMYRCNNVTFVKDIKAEVIQRDRDHGLAYYNDYRKLCGLGKAESFDDFLDFIPKQSVDLLKTLYASHDDVDLSVGAALETHWNGALVGPTYLCILMQQFKHTRVSDRFFYEHSTAGFSPEQLREIRKSTLSKILCDNGDRINEIQINCFLSLPDEGLVNCGVIPEMNLLKWKE